MKRLPNKVKVSLQKARDAGLLAVEIYNKPAIKFKSGGYITLMNIAWTALFHAIFFRNKIKPFHREGGWKFIIREGDFLYWELEECLRQYYKEDTSNPVRKNLDFFIPLRNKIEHKSLPEIDSNIFGECQAMLLNFDELLEKEFGEEFCLRESLSFSLQLFPSRQSLSQAIKHNPVAKPIIEFINNYRSSITTEIFESKQYTFKAFLIQVANHQSKEALPIQFINYDKLTESQKEEFGKFVAMVKFKEGNSLASTVAPTTNPTATPIRITTDVNAPVYKLEDLNKTHPFRAKEIISALSKAVGVQLNSFHFQCIKKEFQINEQRPDFCYKPITGSSQYSQAFIDWLIAAYKKDNDFFNNVRTKYVKSYSGSLIPELNLNEKRTETFIASTVKVDR